MGGTELEPVTLGLLGVMALSRRGAGNLSINRDFRPLDAHCSKWSEPVAWAQFPSVWALGRALCPNDRSDALTPTLESIPRRDGVPAQIAVLCSPSDLSGYVEFRPCRRTVRPRATQERCGV